MKTITVKEDRTMYEAIDGTRFYDRAECETYEGSAKCILESRFKKLIIGEYNSWELMGGFEDHVIYALSLKSEKDVEVALQRFYLDNSYLCKDSYEERCKNIENKFYKALEINSPMLVGLNCDGEMYVLDTLQHYIDNFSAIVK